MIRVGLTVGIIIWLAGSAYALSFAHYPPGACRRPYQAWALTWPVFNILPHPAKTWLLNWSYSLCEPRLGH
jgi:hypothetical protein